VVEGIALEFLIHVAGGRRRPLLQTKIHNSN
jgi:hypothetical protein